MEHQLATKSEQKEQLEKSASSSLRSKPAEQTRTHPVLRLQRAIGNQAVQNLVRSGQTDGQAQQTSPDVEPTSTIPPGVNVAEKDAHILTDAELQSEYELTREWLLQHSKSEAGYASSESYFRTLERELFQRGNVSAPPSTTSQTAPMSVPTSTEASEPAIEQAATEQIMHLLNSPGGFDLKAGIDLLMTLDQSSGSSLDPKYKVTEWLHKHKKDTDLPVGAERSMQGIKNTKVYKGSEGKLSALEYFGKISIDIDGVSYNLAIDPDSQAKTTLKVQKGNEKESLDAYAVPYSVLSGTFRDILGKKALPPGTLGLIEYKGRYVATVLGDIGPHRSTGEASAYAVRQLGLPVKVVKSKSKKKELLRGGLDEPEAHYYFFAGTAPKGSLKPEDVTPEAIKARLEEVIKQRLLDHMLSTK